MRAELLSRRSGVDTNGDISSFRSRAFRNFSSLIAHLWPIHTYNSDAIQLSSTVGDSWVESRRRRIGVNWPLVADVAYSLLLRRILPMPVIWLLNVDACRLLAHLE